MTRHSVMQSAVFFFCGKIPMREFYGARFSAKEMGKQLRE